MDVKRRLLVVSMPFKLGVGGFLRSHYILPKLTRYLAESNYEVELYVPANALRTFATYFLENRGSAYYTRGNKDMLDEPFNIAYNEIIALEKKSQYAFVVNERVLEENVRYNRLFLRKELKQGSASYSLLIPERLRPLLIHLFEKKFVGIVKHLFRTPHFGYSMHETADAVTALTALSSKETGVVVLLQLDLGNKIVEKMVNVWLFKNLHKKTKLMGILSVSSAPIIETPMLYHLSNNVKVLVPGVALGEDVPLGKKLKEPGTVVYYGRISKEKGIFDLLKAWSIVEKNEDAMLYVAGKFEDYKMKAKFEKAIKKYDLRRVAYLGYLEREKLLERVARFSVLAYPSYRDSFSLTVLESLAMGLRVVAYDIPALHYIYRGSRNVKLVPAGDVKQLALNIIENLKKPFERDNATTRILDLHSSWEKVALEEYNQLNEVLK